MGKRNKNKFWREQQAAASRPHIVINIFVTAERQGWVCPHLNLSLIKAAFDPRVLLSFGQVFNIHPISAARNLAVRDFFKYEKAGLPKPEWLCMFDNDIGPPENFLDVVLSAPEEADVVILPYFVWKHDLNAPALCFGHWRNDQMESMAPEEVRSGWLEGGAGGTGAMFIRRRVLTDGKMPDPPFKILYDNYEGQKMSEDIWFTSEAYKLGYRIFTHTEYPCSHYHSLDLLTVSAGIGTLVKKLAAEELAKK